MVKPSINRQEMLQLTFWFLIFSDILLLGWWNMLLPAATLLLLLILLGAGGLWIFMLRRHGFGLLRTPLDGGLLLLVVVMIASSWWGLDPSRSWRFVWQWSACIWLFYLSVTLIRAGWSLTAFGKGLILTLAVILIGAYYQLYGLLQGWYGAGPWPDLLPPAIPRIWGLTISPNVLAIMTGGWCINCCRLLAGDSRAQATALMGLVCLCHTDANTASVTQRLVSPAGGSICLRGAGSIWSARWPAAEPPAPVQIFSRRRAWLLNSVWAHSASKGTNSGGRRPGLSLLPQWFLGSGLDCLAAIALAWQRSEQLCYPLPASDPHSISNLVCSRSQHLFPGRWPTWA